MTTMTNREYLATLNTPNFIKNVKSVVIRNSRHFDIEGYLDSEDRDISHFVKAIGTCQIKPSESEIISYKNEMRVEGKIVSEDEISKYITEHAKSGFILEKTKMFAQEYYTIYDAENDSIFKTPCDTAIAVIMY